MAENPSSTGALGRLDATRRDRWWPAPVRALPPLHIAAFWMVLLIANAWYLSWTVAEMLLTDSAADWHTLEHWSTLAGSPSLYAPIDGMRLPWSPLTPYLLAVLVPLGTLGWRLLHLVAAAALPSWRLRSAVLLSWPFWFDLSVGNVLVFAFLAAVWALRGSRVGAYAFFAIALLVPRPLMVPVLIWLLWKRPELRSGFLIIAAVNVVLVALTGLGPTWIEVLLTAVGPRTDNFFNLAPTRLVGPVWLLIGVPLAACLTWKARLGWASLALSPFLWPNYLIFGLLELTQPPGSPQ